MGTGGATAGIYSRSGSEVRVSLLLSSLRLKDAWELRLSDFSVHDVATALKLFCSNLPQPLLPAAVTAVAESGEMTSRTRGGTIFITQSFQT